MNFNEYQKTAQTTAIYPEGINGLSYLVLGLCGETGEVAEKLKKVIRDGRYSDIKEIKFKKEEIKKELGDVLWYLASLSHELGIPLNEVAEKNIEKLKSRKQRGKIGGSGDNR